MNTGRRAVLAGLGGALLTAIGGFPACSSDELAVETLDFERAAICGFWGKPRFRHTSAVADAAPEAVLVTRKITGLVGLVPNFDLREADFEGGRTAFAVTWKEKRFIVFDRAKFDWRSGRPSWHEIGILAHEIGHHLNGHTLDNVGSRWQTESEADWFAGFVIARLGGTLEDALKAFSFLGKRGSKTHPPRHMRLQVVEEGWRHAQSLEHARR